MGQATFSQKEGVLRITIFFVMFVMGVFGCGLAVKDYANARASVRWPTVDGVILENHQMSVRYAYSWRGRTHERTRRTFFTGTKVSNFEELPSTVPGKFVKVYVSPNDPRRAVLEPGGSREIFVVLVLLGGGIVFVSGGALIQCFASIEQQVAPARVSIDHGQLQFSDR